MNADLLRRAATLMRERANAATPSGEGYAAGWAGHSIPDVGADIFGGPCENGYRTGTVLHWDNECEAGCAPPSQADVEHIIGWHPAVALAVANWLVAEANLLDGIEPLVELVSAVMTDASGGKAALRLGKKADGSPAMHADSSAQAFAVARAYLGEQVAS
jgi:hypothetical protein